MGTIHEFYKNATVLITGGTGFLGKVLVEKLLQGFDLKKIILLIRSKHGEDPTERLLSISNDPIFRELHEQSPDCFNKKVVTVKVNYDMDDLGITECDLDIITREVQIVFHAMAALNLNENQQNDITTTILGTRRVLDLAKQIEDLKAFVHVSTFYAQCHCASVEEKIDVPGINCEQLLDMTTNLGLKKVEDIKDELMDNMPNTYTLTKRYAEGLATKKGEEKISAVIFRPPMLTSVYKKPLPRLTDNPMSFSVAISKGFAHVLKCDESKKSYKMPIDYCVNAILATAWDVNGRKRVKNDMIPFYNFLFNEKDLTWIEYFENLVKPNHEQPPANRMLHRLVLFCKTSVVIILLVISRLSIGKHMRSYRNYQMFKRFINSISIISLNDWSFQNDNVVELDKKLKALEVQNLESNAKPIDWTSEYAKSYIPGLQMYFFEERVKNLSCLSEKHQRMEYLHGAVNIFLLVCCLSFVYLIHFK